MTRLEFELAYNDSAAYCFNHLHHAADDTPEQPCLEFEST